MFIYKWRFPFEGLFQETCNKTDNFQGKLAMKQDQCVKYP